MPGVYLVEGWAYGDDWDTLPLSIRLMAVVLMHGPEATFCLHTAARIGGLQGAGRDDGIVHVRLPPGRERHQVDGVQIHTWLVRPEQITTYDGWRLTTPDRTVLDLALRLDRWPAVSLMDSALNQGLIGQDDLARLELESRGRPGAVRCRGWWPLADGRAQSPLETGARLVAVDCGHPPDELQIPIHDQFGILLGLGDLAWKRPHRRTMVVEADGREPHEAPRALYRDRYRANDFTATGDVDMYRITWDDVVRPAYYIGLLHRNLAS